MKPNMKQVSIYIHYPFCLSKCHYCDFVSFTGLEDMFPAYLRVLGTEIIHSPYLDKGLSVQTVFFGGGTPSLPPSHHVTDILGLIRKFFNLRPTAEITVECNPETLNEEKLQNYKKAGVNRLSLGLQAAQNELLAALGRVHTWERFVECYALTQKKGFQNINIDIMFGLPGQTMADVDETLQNVLALRPPHLSAYSLTLDQKTVMGREWEAGKLLLPDDETDRRMYERVKTTLKKAGYHHYEISNFALPGFECRHNIVYWTGHDYIGYGLAAHSFAGGYRFFNTSDFNKYLNGVTLDAPPTLAEGKDAYAEYLFTGLRLIDGIRVKSFEQNFGAPLMDIYGAQIKQLVKDGLLAFHKDRLKLTAKGIDLSNMVFQAFLP